MWRSLEIYKLKSLVLYIISSLFFLSDNVKYGGGSYLISGCFVDISLLYTVQYIVLRYSVMHNNSSKHLSFVLLYTTINSCIMRIKVSVEVNIFPFTDSAEWRIHISNWIMRIVNKHMTEPWLDQALMQFACRSAPLSIGHWPYLH